MHSRTAVQQAQQAAPSSNTSAEGDYTESELSAALAACGIGEGDVVFVQVALDALGSARDCASDDQRSAMVLRALRHAVGETGTLVVPTYTFSFCRYEPFDLDSTPTTGGPWSPSAEFLEHVRHAPDAMRSRDPIHS